MYTTLKSIHEETYSDNSKTLGVLINYNEENNFKESFIYVYKEGMYIFFETMIDMIDYLLYGENKMKRAYMEEKDFDELYDQSYVMDGKFSEKLIWS